MSAEYRLMQEGMVVAASTSLPDMLHYALVYGQDGPVEIQTRHKGRWVRLDLSARA